VRPHEISEPERPVQVAALVPPAPPGRPAVPTNDVFVDRRGFVFAIDRYDGLSVLEFRRTE
jgi:hypothetical protein